MTHAYYLDGTPRRRRSPIRPIYPVGPQATWRMMTSDAELFDDAISPFASSSMSATGTASTSVSSTLYYVAAELPGDEGKHPHMTIAIVPKANDDESGEGAAATQLDRLIADLRQLASTALPLTVTLGETALFGKNKDIPVQRLSIASASDAAVVDAFSAKWHNPPDRKGVKQEYHVTGQKVWRPGTPLVSNRLYIRIVGSKAKEDVFSCDG